MFPFDEGEHCLRQMWLQTTWQSGLRIVLDKDLHDAELFKYKKERLYHLSTWNLSRARLRFALLQYCSLLCCILVKKNLPWQSQILHCIKAPVYTKTTLSALMWFLVQWTHAKWPWWEISMKSSQKFTNWWSQIFSVFAKQIWNICSHDYIISSFRFHYLECL